MGVKLGKGEFPQGHGPDDFECFGPAAVADDQFDGTRICDMGCFKQDGVDSNKFYHGAIVQSTKNKSWFAYFQWGRTGATNPDCQFVQCSSEADAAAEYKSQLRSKNAGRGEWVTVAGMKTLRAKAGKDCYLVRPQATRATGLPSAKTIQCDDGVKKAPVTVAASTTKGKKSSPTIQIDSQTMSLMRDLNVATISYTKGAMANDSLPTQGCIDDARTVLGHALGRVGKVGHNVDAQVNDKELKELTGLIYSKIPKKKSIGAAASTWILSADNIRAWQLDLDAFESALMTSLSSPVTVQKNPLEGLGVEMKWLDTSSNEGEWVAHFATTGTRNVHGGLGKIRIHNLWSVCKPIEHARFIAEQDKVAARRPSSNERPMFAPRERPDMNADRKKAHETSRSALLFHGTRSVNVSGILGKSLLLPRQLSVSVAISGALFGPGLYFADDIKKSAGYCSLSQSVWSGGSGGVGGRHAFMFLVDVVLGRPYVVPQFRAFTSPPAGFDSVFGKANYADMGGSTLRNNEWIVYETPKHSLRYLIEFSA